MDKSADIRRADITRNDSVAVDYYVGVYGVFVVGAAVLCVVRNGEGVSDDLFFLVFSQLCGILFLYLPEQGVYYGLQYFA